MNAKKLIVALLAILIAVSIGVYVYDVVANGTPYTENLFKVVLVVVSLGLSIGKVFTRGTPRNSLDFYEKNYAKELEGVFVREPKSRKMLLEAIRYFNESKYQKAVSLFEKLKSTRPSKHDLGVVCLFSALCHDEWGLIDEAIKEYHQVLANDPQNATALSNLGILYTKNGEYAKAAECYEKAIETDPANHFAYNNLAQLYYRAGEYEGAVEYSHMALKLCPNFKPSVSLLAVIYGGYGYEKEYGKYLKIAVQEGADAESIEMLAKSVSGTIDEDSELPEELLL